MDRILLRYTIDININAFASIAFTTFFCPNRNICAYYNKSFGNDVSHHALLYKLTFIVRAQCTYYKLSREFTNIYRYAVIHVQLKMKSVSRAMGTVYNKHNE